MIKFNKTTSPELEDAVIDGQLVLATSGRRKAWVAEITGTHPVYKLNYNFIDEDDKGARWKAWDLEEGKIYCFSEYKKQFFVTLKNEELIELTKEQAAEAVETAEAVEAVEAVEAYAVIGGQYESYFYGTAKTLSQAKKLADDNIEYWDNFQGWHTPQIYKIEDTKKIISKGRITSSDGQEIIIPIDKPSYVKDTRKGKWIKVEEMF